MIWGVLVHAFMLTNKLPNWDDVNNLKGYGVGSEFGRWFLKYAAGIDGDWSVPWINGTVAIFFLALSACLVMMTLRLTSVTSAVLVPLMMVSFPSVASTFTFMFTADAYAVSIFLCCLGAYLFRRHRFGFLPALVCFCLSLGIYQSYICLAAGLLALGFLRDLLEGRKTAEIVRKGIVAIAVLGVSMILYMIIGKIIYPLPLESHNGFDQMGRLDLLRLPRLFLRSIKRVAEYFVLKPYSFITAGAKIVNILVCVWTALLWGALLVKRRLHKEPVRLLLYLFVSVMLVVAMGAIYIMAPDANMSMLMFYQYLLIYIMLIVLLEMGIEPENGLLTQENSISARKESEKGRAVFMRYSGQAAGWAAVGLLLLTGYENFLITNEAYFRMNIAYERSYAYYNRIVARLEETEGYTYGEPVALIGEYGLSETPDLLGSFSIDGERYDDFSGVAKETGLLTSGARHNFMKTYIGINMPDVSDGEIKSVMATEEYAQMPSYPAEGCVKKIQGIWVVKACEETKAATKTVS